ncbi:tubulin polymerization-promoting protein family member 2 isoform X1 [Octopus bimaculoides]|uniref:tubulin polymerization-promoting protein family member 2 isoform X1 n=1 Tax=Octopus bimaculoides TaxID=37653 RepID=UPI00071CDB7C|nr:tubulin polymerization-promoting protein family member 2 isoform X1 [Octopus bimaculoides]|eukprot:XP_014777243.1 PREDICTED: tubulin polymerization-promoting protein family member 2-like isoform X1 [Octopus bimaculoides]
MTEQEKMSDDLKEVFKAFVKLAGAKTESDMKMMNSKACGKMVKDCLPKDVSGIADASIFPKYKEKGKPYMLMENFPQFIRGCAHEYAKLKSKDLKLPLDDPKVEKYYQSFVTKLSTGRPNVKEVKVSKTGNVDKLTDVSGYTGTHKERFDAEGKGKGIEGRVNLQDESGYVGNYKGAGTFDEKK